MSFPRSQGLEGIIFDKDGTLFDFQGTWADWTAGFLSGLATGDPDLTNRLAQAFRFDMESRSFGKTSPMIAGTADAMIAAVRSVIPDISEPELRRDMARSTAEVPQAETTPLRPLMDRLQGAGYVLGVATNDAEIPARAHLQTAGIMDHFTFIAGYDTGYGAKPDLGMLKAFCERTAILPERCVMVGDSRHDLSSGRAAGMVTIAVLTGIAEAAELEDLADAILPDIGALPAWLGI